MLEKKGRLTDTKSYDVRPLIKYYRQGNIYPEQLALLGCSGKITSLVQKLLNVKNNATLQE